MSDAAGPPERITERIERLRTLEGGVRSARPPAPRSAKIELTSRCNFACRFCASHLRPGRRRDMDWPLYTRLARELREAGVEQLGLFYIGESLLHERLEEAIRYAKTQCGYPYVFLTTNGSLAHADRVRGLMLAGLDSLKFALNFADGGQLACVGGETAATLETVLRNILDACGVRDEIQAQTGARCAVSASSLSYDEHQAQRMEPVLSRLRPHLDQHYWLPVYGGAASSRKPLPCWPLFTEAHITADGRLSVCGLDHSARFHAGDLAVSGFMEAWHAPAFQALRTAHLRGEVGGTACALCVGYAGVRNEAYEHDGGKP